jgi:hypothetical protein
MLNVKPDLLIEQTKFSLKQLINITNFLKEDSYDNYEEYIEHCINNDMIIDCLKLTKDFSYDKKQKEYLLSLYNKEDVNYRLNPKVYEQLFINSYNDIPDFDFFNYLIGRFILKEDNFYELLMKHKNVINWKFKTFDIISKISANNLDHEPFLPYYNFKNYYNFNKDFFEIFNRIPKSALQKIDMSYFLASYKNLNYPKNIDIVNIFNFYTVIEEQTIIDDFPDSDFSSEIISRKFLKTIKEAFGTKELISYISKEGVDIYGMFFKDNKEHKEKIKWYKDFIFYSNIDIIYDDTSALEKVSNFIYIYKGI